MKSCTIRQEITHTKLGRAIDLSEYALITAGKIADGDSR